jgi:hypothetical protein
MMHPQQTPRKILITWMAGDRDKVSPFVIFLFFLLLLSISECERRLLLLLRVLGWARRAAAASPSFAHGAEAGRVARWALF